MVTSEGTEARFTGHLMGVDPNPPLVRPDQSGHARGHHVALCVADQGGPMFLHLLLAQGFTGWGR